MKFYLIFLAALFLFSCQKAFDPNSCKMENEVNIEDIDQAIIRNAGPRFFFLDKNQKDLLNLKDINSIPLTYKNEFVKRDSLFFWESFSFLVNHNRIEFDTLRKQYGWYTDIYGKFNYQPHVCYIKISETDIDTLTVKFKFLNHAIGGKYYPSIYQLYYNKTLIKSDEHSPCSFEPKDVFITKDGDNTYVSFTR